jgi:hypothetical protein
VEEILNVRRKGRGYHVLVKWTGYAQPTWKLLSAFLDNEALDMFEAEYGKITEDTVEGRDGVYMIKVILKVRREGRGKQLLVKWTGYAQPTWMPLRKYCTQTLNLGSRLPTGRLGTDISGKDLDYRPREATQS